MPLDTFYRKTVTDLDSFLTVFSQDSISDVGIGLCLKHQTLS